MSFLTLTCNGITWYPKHPDACVDMLGYIPEFLSAIDPRPAAEQFDERYRSGGWKPFKGFRMRDNGNMRYPGDPETRLLYEATLNAETIRVYESAWVAVVQPGGEFSVARLD
jgi:hypothetical protein